MFRWLERRRKKRRPKGPSAYQAAVMTLLGFREKITIAVIGANDGRINDPIYDFVRAHADRTRVLLVEPQPALRPYLQENYAFHPEHRIVQCAIGAGENIRLYGVQAKHWGAFSPSYARGWPAYRAPTGVTSSDWSHVAGWSRPIRTWTRKRR